MSWSNRNLGLRLLAESSHPYPRLHSSAAPRLSNRVMYFLLGAYTKRRASGVLSKTERLAVQRKTSGIQNEKKPDALRLVARPASKSILTFQLANSML